MRALGTYGISISDYVQWKCNFLYLTEEKKGFLVKKNNSIYVII